MREEASKNKEEQKGEGSSHKKFEDETIVEYRRIAEEEHRRIRIERKEKKPEETGDSTSVKHSIPRPLIMHSEPAFSNIKIEPRVVSPASVTLNDKQRAILYLLYNMFKGKSLKDILPLISSALGYDVEDVLHEIMGLENLNLITVSNGVVSFTGKGEILVGSIAIDKNIISGVRESRFEVSRTPSIIIPRVTGKPLDKQTYLATVKTPRKEPAVPSVPEIRVIMPSLVDVSRNVSIVLKHGAENTSTPPVPQVAPSEISAKPLDKTTFITLLKHEIEEKPVTKVAEEGKVATSKHMRLPSSLLTMLFKPVEKYSVKGLIRVKPDRPVIIVAVKQPNDDYIATLLSILREIYRIKVGGLPVGRYTGTKVAKYIAEDELMRQGLIKVIDDSKADFLGFFGISKIEDFDKIDLNKLRDRLTELSVQGLSFLVFYIDRSKVNPMLTYLAFLRDKIAPAKVVVISPRELSVEHKRELARATWGFVDPKEPLINDTLDQHFKRREEEFNDILEEIIARRKYARIVRESHEEDSEEGSKGIESALHYQLKVFIVYYLMKKLGIPEEDVETEVELLVDGGRIIPDVYVKSKRLAIEVETFYGTGIVPWRKLERTIEKYVKSKVADEVWIVIPPLQAMLYLKDLVSEARELREKGYGYIKLYTIDLSKRRLVPIEKISRKLSKLYVK